MAAFCVCMWFCFQNAPYRLFIDLENIRRLDGRYVIYAAYLACNQAADRRQGLLPINGYALRIVNGHMLCTVKTGTLKTAPAANRRRLPP